MKKQLMKSLLAISLIAPVFTAGAATYNVGTFYTTPENPDGDYTIETSGLFWDEFDFRTDAPGYSGRSNMTFSGSHSGMFDSELLLVNLNTRQTYTLEEEFSITFDNLYDRTTQRFAITGAGLSSADPTLISSYTLSMDAAYGSYANPVPVPAAAWLFASGLMGFMTYRRKRGTALM